MTLSNSVFPVLALLLAAGSSSAAPPHIFFSDLESGPNRGGRNNGGLIVTAYGARFGASRGGSTVTVGGGVVETYITWADNKIAFQLSNAATTGDIVVTTPAGVSNGIPFTVRPGKIYFVAATGRDGNDGSYDKPWRTLLKARDAIQPGDTVYAMDGTTQAADDGQGWRATMLLRRGGNPGMPMALVAYPGAKVTIGNEKGPEFGIRTTQPSYWVLAGLTLRGRDGALALGGPSSHWRIVGNDISCPDGDGQSGCLVTGQVSNLAIHGNNIHHAGRETASAHYHGVYLSTDSNHVDMGWNTVAYVRGCRGVQVYSTPLGPGGAADPTGHNMFDLRFHDNLIRDTQCDGIILATVDPSLGKVELYNNVVYNAGMGPRNPENTGGWTCISVPGSTANGPPGSGTVEVYQNTLYNCGSFASPPYVNANAGVENGGNNKALKIRLRNNIIYQTSAAPYIVIFGPADGVYGENNLFFGNGAAPAHTQLVRSISADPQFAMPSEHDFRLNIGSPARGAGVETAAGTDRAGLPRGRSAGYDLGAFQYALTDLNIGAPIW